MSRRRADLTPLFVLACAMVLLLLLLSDFGPNEIDTFNQLPEERGRVSIACVVTDVKASEKGWLLMLRDCEGGEVRAFLRNDSAVEPPIRGAPVVVIGEPSEDDPLFLFVESLTPLASSHSTGAKG